MKFDEKIKVVCSESGINLREISELSGISYEVLKKYSQGKRNPKDDRILQIANIPQLEPWREFLLEPSKLTEDEAEFMILFARLKAQGKESEALAILRDLEDESNAE